MDTHGQEMGATDLWQLFEHEYLQSASPLKYLSHRLSETDGIEQSISARLQVNGHPITVCGQGNGPIDAFLQALNNDIRVFHYEEHALSQGSDATAIAYVEIGGAAFPGSLYGVGIHANIVTASLLAILSAVNRSLSMNSNTQAVFLENLGGKE